MKLQKCCAEPAGVDDSLSRIVPRKWAILGHMRSIGVNVLTENVPNALAKYQGTLSPAGTIITPVHRSP